MFDEQEPKDWEIRDEEPPERLQKKWEQEEARGPRRVLCPSCKKETPAENLTCLFCGTVLPENDIGGPRGAFWNRTVRGFLAWVQSLWKKK